MLMNMNWKSVKGYEDLYEISDTGLVRRKDGWVNNNGTMVFRKTHLMKTPLNYYGYPQVNLTKDGKRKVYTVHTLVAQAFIPNPDNKLCIDHINCNRSDNRVENLRWVTHKENSNNPITKPRMGKYWNKKIVLKDVEGNTTIFNSIKDAVNKTKLSRNTVYRSLIGEIICKGKIRFEYGAA